MKTGMLLGSLPQYFDGKTLGSLPSERKEKKKLQDQSPNNSYRLIWKSTHIPAIFSLTAL